MTRTSPKTIDESTLEKRQLCKPYVLRKSVGNEIGERAFAEWLSSQPDEEKTDKHPDLIATTLWPLVKEGRLANARGSNLIPRGRGRIIVELAKSTHEPASLEQGNETAVSSSPSERSSGAASNRETVPTTVWRQSNPCRV